MSAALLSALLAGTAAAGEAAPPRLAVAVPPGPGVLRGFGRDLFAAVAREAGFAFEPVEAAPGDALRLLAAGRVAVAAGPFPPDGAGPALRLAPVAVDGPALLKRRGDGALRTAADAGGKRLAPLPGARGSAARPGLADPYRDLAAGRLAALAGPVAAVAAAALARPGQVEAVGPPPGRARPLAPAMRPDDPRRPAVAAALNRMRADGRLAELQRRWFGFAWDPPGGAAR